MCRIHAMYIRLVNFDINSLCAPRSPKWQNSNDDDDDDDDDNNNNDNNLSSSG
jgi:hypothetical protein